MKFTTASNVVIPSEYFNRITTGNEALDFLFGDGLLPGSTITLSAKHGTGKTQFSLQLLELLSKKYSVGYVSNEETVEQLAFTCRRIGTPNVPIANVRSVSDVVEAMQGLQVLIVDSFSKLEVEDVRSAVKTEKIAIDSIIRAAKKNKCTVILITHNTKNGQSKGTSLVQHDVDATLYIEKDEEDSTMRRVFFDKNRFGSPNEVFLSMTANGLILQMIEKSSDEDAPKKSKESKTSRQYKEIAAFLTANKGGTAAEVAKSINVDYTKAQMLLRDMTKLDTIRKSGRGQYAMYKMVQKAPQLAVVA